MSITVNAAVTRPACRETPSAPGERPLLELVGAGTRVPLAPGGTRSYADLDGAASTPASVQVAAAVSAALPHYASAHRGAGYLSQVSTAALEDARTTVAEFVGAREDDLTVFTRNTTDALTLLASAVPAGGRVLVLDVEHHAALLPWDSERTTVLVARDTITETMTALGTELAGTRYALVVVTGASNVTGESLPLERVVATAHATGARVVVDGAQLLPHRGFSLRETKVDYVAFSGHKTYAPFGTGALVGRADWLDAAHPHQPGGGASARVDDTGVQWRVGHARHEGGSPNILGAVALATACRQLQALPGGALTRHEQVLRERLIEGLSGLRGPDGAPAVRFARFWSDSVDPVGVVTFAVRDEPSGRIAAYLSAEHGIGVRDGGFCAHRGVVRLGFGEGAVRASIGAGTSREDVERLIDALARYLGDGPRCRYEQVDGRWQPVCDPRPAPQSVVRGWSEPSTV